MRSLTFRIAQLAALVLITAATVSSQSIQRVERDDDSDSRGGRNDEPYRGGGGRIDRYLETQVWTDQDDGDYYEGDPITIFFRTNRDAYVAIYSVDTRGRVNLLFPAESGEDNFVTGGATYRLPGVRDNYNLKVSGPEGKEHIQIIASRENFPIPNWYRNSGIVSVWADVDEFMDDLNDQNFVRYPGQRFAYDRAVIFVNEWEDNYYRPIYHPVFHDWDVCGNVYIDYPYGGAVYINGIYWGCAPLYIPRIGVGWHTVTIYDRNGYCWENDFNVHHSRTVVLDRQIVHPQAGIRSKYKEVQIAGYVDPARAGYKTVKVDPGVGSTKVRNGGDNFTTVNPTDQPLSRKYMRGDGAVVKTDRGFEVANADQPDPQPQKGRSHYGSSIGSEKSRGGADYNNTATEEGRHATKVRTGNSGTDNGQGNATESSSSGSNVQKGRDHKRVNVTPPANPGSGTSEAGKGKPAGGASEAGKAKGGAKETPPAQNPGSAGGGKGKSKNPR